MRKVRTHYDNLKVSQDAPDFVIRAAYKTLSQRYHPDRHPGDERMVHIMAIINKSYEVLSDPVRRREHDAWIEREQRRFEGGVEASGASVSPSGRAGARARGQAGAVGQPQENPIPPQWQNTAEAAETPTERKGSVARYLLMPVMVLVALVGVLPRIMLPLLLFAGFWLWNALSPDPAPRPVAAVTKPYQPAAAGAPTQTVVAQPRTAKPRWERPEGAPNGSPWPTRAAYVNGYPVNHNQGHSEITVDNTKNDSDVFVKLFYTDGAAAYPVRQFYIPGGEKFKMDRVDPGTYDLRYMDLGNGALTRSESFEVREHHTSRAIEYSTLTMTLYKVQGGNFQTWALDASEF